MGPTKAKMGPRAGPCVGAEVIEICDSTYTNTRLSFPESLASHQQQLPEDQTSSPEKHRAERVAFSGMVLAGMENAVPSVPSSVSGQGDNMLLLCPLRAWR